MEMLIFFLGDHHFKVSVLEVPICPSPPCSLASAVEMAFSAVFPSSPGHEEPSMSTICKSHEAIGKVVINPKSCGPVINECCESQVSEVMIIEPTINHVDHVFCVPKKSSSY